MHDQPTFVFERNSDISEDGQPCAVCNDLDFNRSQRKLDDFTLSDFEDQECHSCDLIVRAISAIFPQRVAKEPYIFLEVSGCIEDTVQIILHPTAKREATQGEERAYTDALLLHTPRDHGQNTSASLPGGHARVYFDGIRRRVAAHVDSDECWELIRKWDNDCQSAHQYCRLRQALNLPKRVVHVGNEQTNAPIRLCETNGMRAHYIALSHCWARENILKTNLSTLQERLVAIEWDELSPNFRDAIIVTRKLGIDYIWIDALCIIQDDLKDWETESAKMQDVYANAYLTIAAGSASNHGQGFLKTRANKSIELAFSNHKHVPDGKVLARLELHQYGDSSPFQWSRAPLFKRGWIYQERLLSSRVLYFEESELLWDCQTDIFCECGDFPRSYFFKTDSLHVIHNFYMLCKARDDGFDEAEHKHCKLNFDEWQNYLYDWWYSKAVTEYGSLKFTKDTDRLPALSGLARVVAHRLGDAYLAGLWKNSLHHGLQWYNNSNEIFFLSRMLSMYGAPSWSWASIDNARIDYCPILKLWKGLEHAYTEDATVLSASTVPLGSDDFGQIVHGHITLLAEVVPAMLRRRSETILKDDFLLSLNHDAAGDHIWETVAHCERDNQSRFIFFPDIGLDLVTHESDEDNHIRNFRRPAFGVTRTWIGRKHVSAKAYLLRLGNQAPGTKWVARSLRNGLTLSVGTDRVHVADEGNDRGSIIAITYLVLSPVDEKAETFERIGLMLYDSPVGEKDVNLAGKIRLSEMHFEKKEVTIF